MKRLTAVSLALLWTPIPGALADPSCIDWERQPNGCKQRVCVGDDGKSYCEELCPSDKTPRKIDCNK